MLEQRVAAPEQGFQRLELKFDAMATAMQRVEVALRDLAGLRSEMGALRTEVRADVADLKGDVADLKIDMKVEVAEIKGKISMLPTWWMMLVGMAAILGTGAAIVRFL